ncbi:MAG: hypothetical protein ACREQL_04430 [Candidatus Binatia bacterium]
MNRDFVEMLSALSAEGVEFLLVGAYAMAAHGWPRATGDIDIWVKPTAENADRVIRALQRYGAPLFDLTVQDLIRPDTVFQIGVPPGRVDILSGVSGITFEEAWISRITATMGDVAAPVIGFDALLKNKLASGRPKDLADVAWLKARQRK